MDTKFLSGMVNERKEGGRKEGVREGRRKEGRGGSERESPT
jgi:hypothetical protein